MLYVRKVLKEVVKVNKMFQAENADITKLTQELLSMYRNLVQMIVEPRSLSKCSLENLPNLKFIDHLIPLCAIQFGYDFSTTAANCLNETQITCQRAMYEVCCKIIQRSPVASSW